MVEKLRWTHNLGALPWILHSHYTLLRDYMYTLKLLLQLMVAYACGLFATPHAAHDAASDSIAIFSWQRADTLLTANFSLDLLTITRQANRNANIYLMLQSPHFLNSHQHYASSLRNLNISVTFREQFTGPGSRSVRYQKLHSAFYNPTQIDI